MVATIDVISELQKLKSQLPASERKVAEYILANLNIAVHSTLSEIAKASGVSVATVNRLCHSLNCDGFKDFKIRLAQNVAVSIRYLEGGDRQLTSSHALVGRVFDLLIERLNSARNQLKPEDLDQSIHALSHARRIAFIGVGGGSANVAAEGANRFFRLGIPAESECDGYKQRMLVSTFGPGDVVFAISSTGLPQELLDCAVIAKQYGATSICLTRPGSPLVDACDIALVIDSPEDGDMYKPTASRLVFTAVLDVLATGVAISRPKETREMLRRIRSSLVVVQDSIKPQPVGD
jgi:DNA-binding MurR/RpiR family transcriptional regulator